MTRFSRILSLLLIPALIGGEPASQALFQADALTLPLLSSRRPILKSSPSLAKKVSPNARRKPKGALKAASRQPKAASGSSGGNWTRRGMIGAALMAVTGGIYKFWSGDSGVVPQWKNTEHMRAYVAELIGEMMKYAQSHNRPEEMQILHMFLETFELEDMGAVPAAVKSQSDSQGPLPVYPRYNKPLVTLVLNPTMLNAFSGIERQTADVYVQSLIWKEVGTTLPKWRYPHNTRIRAQLLQEFFGALKQIGNVQNNDPRVTAMLGNPDFRKKIQIITAITGFNEASGYVEQLNFYRERGWTSETLHALGARFSDKPQISAMIQSVGLFMKFVDADWSDALRLSALVHITEILMRAEQRMQPGIALRVQDQVFYYALEAEAVEGHVGRALGTPQRPALDLARPRFPSNYFPYLNNPEFYAPDPASFGIVPQAQLTPRRSNRREILATAA